MSCIYHTLPRLLHYMVAPDFSQEKEEDTIRRRMIFHIFRFFDIHLLARRACSSWNLAPGPMVAMLASMLLLASSLSLKGDDDEPIDTQTVVSKDDYKDYDNCETPGECPRLIPSVYQKHFFRAELTIGG